MKRYEILLPYKTSDRLVEVFPEMEAEQAGTSTRFVGVLKDQVELHRILARIAELGLEVTEVRQITSEEPGSSVQ